MAGLALSSGPAQAAGRPSAKPTADKKHCVHDVTGRAPTACYASFTEAVSRATAGRVTDAPADVAAALRDKGFEARLNAAADSRGGAGTGAAA